MVTTEVRRPVSVFDVVEQLQLTTEQVRALILAEADPLPAYSGPHGQEWVVQVQYDAWLRRRMVTRERLAAAGVPELTRLEWLVLVAVAACPRYRDAATVLGMSTDAVRHWWRRVIGKYRALGYSVPTKLHAVQRTYQDGLIHLADQVPNVSVYGPSVTSTTTKRGQ